MGDRLATVGFATAHVTALTVVAILLFHRGGALGAALEPVGTIAGTAVLLVLWGVALWTHRQGFAAADPWSVETRRELLELLLVGAAWGAATGVVVFWLLAVGLVATVAVADPAALLGILSVSTLLLAVIETTVSLAAGAAVGVVAAALDALAVASVDCPQR